MKTYPEAGYLVGDGEYGTWPTKGQKQRRRGCKSIGLHLAVVLLLSIIVISCTVKLSIAKELAYAPNFVLQDIRQDIVSLSDYKDKQAVLLFFWTTWSPFCQDELRVLNGMYAGLLKDGVELLAINSGERNNDVQEFVESYLLGYRVLVDTDAKVTRNFNIIEGMPVYILINGDGRIVFRDVYFPKEYKELLAK